MTEKDFGQRIKNTIYGCKDPIPFDKFFQICQQRGINESEEKIIKTFRKIQVDEPKNYIENTIINGEEGFDNFFGKKIRG